MLVVTLDQLQRLCPATSRWHLAALLPSLNESLAPAAVESPLRLAMYSSQLMIESTYFQHFEENLNYSAERLMQVWKLRFPTIEIARVYAHNPQKLANHVYADRNGNGDEDSGDGWKFRGRALPMLTFFDNYMACGRFYGLDLIAHPELVLQPEHLFKPAAWFWRTRGLGPLSDAGQVAPVTQKVNGGQTDAKARAEAFKLACDVFGIAPPVEQV